MTADLQAALGVLAAAVGGAAVGVERQWSGHATGPGAHFAGVRTFTLLGGLGGIAGWLWSTGGATLATAIVAAAGALVVVAYVSASRHDVDGTTEVAALVVIAAGILAGAGHLRLASAIVALTSLLLVEKSRLHALIRRLDDEELRAGARFAVMAVVVLPVLPAGPYGPLGGVRPRELWALVLLFTGLSFAGYAARRVAGARHGYALAGLLGGLASSTGVTLAFARMSRTERQLAGSLAAGAIAACTVLFVRVLVATAVLDAALAAALVPYLVAPFGVGTVAGLLALRRTRGASPVAGPANPLQFWSALQMAVLFQAVLFAVHAARARFGDAGLLASAAVLGLTDVDALTIAMVKSVAAGAPIALAARAIAVGILCNTVLKLALAMLLGAARFRHLVPAGLAAMAAAAGISLGVLR